MSTHEKQMILVVEDDKFLAKAHEAKLTDSGFQPAIVHDGESALAFLKKNTPDLILLDLIMPKMNGFDTLETIHAKPDWRKIPVVILTNLGQDSDRKRGTQLGAVDYLVKTDFSLQQIVEKIQKHLQAK